MKKSFFRVAVLLWLLLMGFESCVNLKYVNDFSAASLKSISNFEAIGYSFKQNCLDNCREKKMSDLVLSAEMCNCNENQKADSVTLLIYNSLRGYLNGLMCLSNNDLTNYKTDALTRSLTEGSFGELNIAKTQTEAYSKISETLLRCFTDKYRKHQIGNYLKTANESFQILIKFLDFNLSSNLAGKLEVQKQRMKPYYFDLTRDQTLSTFEKRKAVEEYYERYDKIESKEDELFSYSKALKKIADGHQHLAENVDRLSKGEIKELLIQSAGDIQDLMAEFNKIKKQ